MYKRQVEGIAHLGEFSRISQYLSSLDVVRKVSWQRVNANKASFVIDLTGDAQGLKEQIALNNVLEETYRAEPVIPIQRGGEQIQNEQVMPYVPRQTLSFRVK